MKSSGDEIYLSADQDGVFVEHSILNLDGASPTHLNFLSSAGPAYCSGRIVGKQVLVSDEAYRILASRFPKASFLACQYFRPIVLGNISVELLPSGESPGSSFLRIEKHRDSLFYAAHWSRKVSSAVRKAVFKPANTLLIRLKLDPMHFLATNSRRETERLLEFAQKIHRAGENLVIVVDSFGESQNLASRLHEAKLPVDCDAKLDALMRIVHDDIVPANVPPWMRNLRKHTVSAPGPSVILMSKQHILAHRPRLLPRGIWVWTGPDLDLAKRTPWLAHIPFSDSFSIQSAPDMAEIQELVSEVKPHQVLILGEGAPNCVHYLAKQGIHAEVFAPPRIETLF